MLSGMARMCGASLGDADEFTVPTLAGPVWVHTVWREATGPLRGGYRRDVVIKYVDTDEDEDQPPMMRCDPETGWNV